MHFGSYSKSKSKRNKESQSQQATGYSLSLKLGERTKVRCMTPSLSNLKNRDDLADAIVFLYRKLIGNNETTTKIKVIRYNVLLL